ncbi:hypothetical protein ACSPRQ_004781 [Escherichia coli]
MDTHDKIPPAYSYSPQPVPEAWKMRFSANSAWFFTDDLTVVDAWLKAHSDGVEVVPLFCGSDSDGKRDTAFEEVCAALARMLHMHRLLLEKTRYQEHVTDPECLRELHEAPIQALNILVKHKLF